MKNTATLILFLFSFIFLGYSQTEDYNLESKNLHRKVRKTIEHYYNYDVESGGFVKVSVNIDRFNEDGNLVETYSLYNSKFTESTPVKKIYTYNKGLLTGTKDVSDIPGTYSSDLKFTYNNNDHLIKKEILYKSGGSTYTIYKNDRKGREINAKTYDKNGKLTSESNTTYQGDIKTNNYVNYSSTDGSIIGNYVTIYNDGIKTNYNSSGKYSNSKTTYNYDKEGNIIKSANVGDKKTYITTYDYEYDKKDNWIKKHYRSGKYQYFYFREIYFDNDDVTGSTEFDPLFINKHGNFGNVNVVPLVKKETKDTHNNQNTSNTNSSYLKDKIWDFDYVYLKEKVKKLNGSVELQTTSMGSLKEDANTTFTVKFSGSTFTFNFKTDTFTTLDDKYEFTFSNSNNETGLLWVYKSMKPLKDEDSGDVFNVNGLFTMKEKNGDSMAFYLK